LIVFVHSFFIVDTLIGKYFLADERSVNFLLKKDLHFWYWIDAFYHFSYYSHDLALNQSDVCAGFDGNVISVSQLFYRLGLL
jgi:hypothetical protein